jgi:thiamine phosphate synthase YjbQ (UPF0047 family)
VEIQIRTGSTEVVHDLTAECERFLDREGAGDGLVHVWVPHATAGLAVLETGAGDDDLLTALGGRLALGTWQSICLVDTNVDNPVRTVRLSLLSG